MKKVKGYKVEFVKKLKATGFPTNSRLYKNAHAAADRAEKKADPKMYKEGVKLERKMLGKNKNELMGKNYKNKKVVKIEKKFKKVAPSIIRHEIKENQELKSHMKKKKK